MWPSRGWRGGQVPSTYLERGGADTLVVKPSCPPRTCMLQQLGLGTCKSRTARITVYTINNYGEESITV